MKQAYENEKIKKLLKDFYSVTKQRVGVFDSDFNCLCEYPKPCCEFCSTIRKSKAGSEACRKCDREGMRLAQSGKTVKYRCHAGLIEVCAPISDGFGTAGYFMFGQVLSENGGELQYKKCRELSKKYFGNEFDKYYSTLKVISDDYLDSVESIMRAYVGYIYLEKMLNAAQSGLAERFIYFAERNYGQDISVDTVARELNVSTSAIFKAVKKQTGVTPSKIIAATRVEKAKQLLSSTNKTVTEIADAVGMHDYNYFSRVFRREIGISPTEYRKATSRE